MANDSGSFRGKLVDSVDMFLSRDLFYCVAGYLVIFSFKHEFLCLNSFNFLSNTKYLWLAPIAYLIGWLLPEICGFCHLIGVYEKEKPGKFMRCCFNCYSPKEFVDIGEYKSKFPNYPFHFNKKRDLIINDKDFPSRIKEYSRIVTQKHICNSFGICLFVSLIIHGIHIIFGSWQCYPIYIFWIILVFILIIIGNLKSIQQVQWVLRIIEDDRNLDSIKKKLKKVKIFKFCNFGVVWFSKSAKTPKDESTTE